MNEQDEAAVLAQELTNRIWSMVAVSRGWSKSAATGRMEPILVQALRAARELGRAEGIEQAAKIADPLVPLPTDEIALAGMDSGDYGYRSACTDIARAIRALLPQPPSEPPKEKP
jgi:hypothetical protein